MAAHLARDLGSLRPRCRPLEKAYAGRIFPIDERVVAEWARLLGAKDKNQRDMAIAATARVLE